MSASDHSPAPGTWPLLALAALAATALVFTPPIAQPQDYHHFADDRSLLGLANAANTLSNLPFLLVGVFGLRALWRERLPGALRELRPAYACFFFGAALTGLGSAWYHLEPDNLRLVWDRLPMTLAFMGLFVAVLGEHVDPRLARRLLLPLLTLGAASVLYWHWSETQGNGDLRPYVLVQFLPILMLPLLLWRYPSRLDRVGHLWLLVGLYLLAKLLEAADAELLALGGLISGHSLKHLVAALAVWTFLRALRRREIRAAGDASAVLRRPGADPAAS